MNSSVRTLIYQTRAIGSLYQTFAIGGIMMTDTPEATETVEQTTLAADDLPPQLRTSLEELQTALQEAVPAEWPDDAAFVVANQPEAIARALFNAGLHDELAGAGFAFLFKQEWASQGKTLFGKLTKSEATLSFLTEFDFVIKVNWSEFAKMAPKTKIALIDHLLSFGYRSLESGVTKVARPDVEEFIGVIDRWGFWQADLIKAAPAMKAAVDQLDLL